ncbi:tRNA-specific adenosine deaminase 2 [Nematocida sp. LUAm3]|nr:tRNA-specific adenosine deaminase 2 [Nematocida sp. LUAm3]KAI5175475.1 tRNA-specific adenosine deaminase 2 [Nematocida sp. LUAm2]KAI5178495.1 tRNA-specific adenosine deaminase 2 [Nematocida sp. LUAm1]
MDIAIEEAKKALKIEEVPIGCAVMHKGVCIEKAHNLTNTLRDPLAHAEILVLRRIKEEVLLESEIFITCEPCIMCLAALVKVKAKKIVYGCANTRFGGVSVLPVLDILPHKDLSISQDVSMVEITQKLLKDFYSLENLRAPFEKRKVKAPERKKICKSHGD